MKSLAHIFRRLQYPFRYRQIDPCLMFQYLACRTMHNMSEAKNSFGLPYNEETSTETILLDLARHCSPRITVRAYTKKKEFKNGADFELYINRLGKKKGMRLRIQAKRLYWDDKGRHKYNKLTGPNSPQWGKLAACAPCIVPLYLFYNHDGFSYGAPFSTFPPALWGCSIAPITAIPPKNLRTPSNIKPMRPWHVLVCDEGGTSNPDLPTLVKNKVNSLYQSGENTIKLKNTNFGFCDEPDWVQATRLDDENSIEVDKYMDEAGVGTLAHFEDCGDIEERD